MSDPKLISVGRWDPESQIPVLSGFSACDFDAGTKSQLLHAGRNNRNGRNNVRSRGVTNRLLWNDPRKKIGNGPPERTDFKHCEQIPFKSGPQKPPAESNSAKYR